MRERSLDKAYSKRLLSPYSGQVQIVESGDARALTLDGQSWEIQYHHRPVNVQPNDGNQRRLSKVPNWIRIAVVTDRDVQRLPYPGFLSAEKIESSISSLSNALRDVSLPLPPADHYELWLLESETNAPLALLYSCVSAEEMKLCPNRTEWTALPSARMKVEQTEDEQKIYTPPVNYRFEQLVTERAGSKPRVQWYDRRRTEIKTFPACLVKENWEDAQDQELCQRYIQRKAPRLLMLHGLNRVDRLRLEQAAKRYALEVERFYQLYPWVADEELIQSIRVEARLRHTNAE